MPYESAGTIISDVAVEVGLVDPGAADAFSSDDTNIIQLVRLLKSVGRDIARGHQWSQLEREHTFSTAAGVETYTLPSDFERLADGTEWNRSEQLPLTGPMTAQGWQVLKSSVVGGALDYFFRVRGRMLALHPAPGSVDTIALEYRSSWWTAVEGSEEPSKEAPTLATDVVLFDGHLVSRALKLAFLEAKGFDTSAALAAYERAWSAATGADGAAPTLCLSGGGGVRLLSTANLPDTGYGGG